MSYWSLTTAPTIDHCIITIYLTNLSVCSPRLPAKTIMVFVRSTSASPATTELGLVACGVACNRPYHAHWPTRPMKGGTYSGDEKATLTTPRPCWWTPNKILQYHQKPREYFIKKQLIQHHIWHISTIGTLSYLDHYHGNSYTDKGPWYSPFISFNL